MTDPLFSVADQVIVVSGGSRGIGKAIAGEFARRDARVIITSRNAETLAAAATELSTGKHPVAFRVCDVADPDASAALIASLAADLGRIDTLVNVAGINVRKRAEAYTVAEYDSILNTNLRGLFFMA